MKSRFCFRSAFWIAILAGSYSAALGATLTGTAIYRERMMLPPGTVFEATLEDVSRADTLAQVLARSTVSRPNTPIKFMLDYDAKHIDARNRYVVRARITLAGKLLFTTDTAHSVDLAKPAPFELVLRRVSPPPSAAVTTSPATVSTASLVNTYWKLMTLNGEAVVVAENQREPYFALQIEGQRVAGFGGCNRFTGSYTLNGDALGFSGIAGTMMACMQGMEAESAFHAMLGKVARWRIEGEQLEVFDAAGLSLARFESRYMR